MNTRLLSPSKFAIGWLCTAIGLWAQLPGGPSVANYDSLQAAIDHNPGRMVFVPAGDHPISAAIHLTTSGSGLWGPGRIVQTNPAADIIDLEGINDVRLTDLILTRAKDHMETHRPAVRIVRCGNVTLDNVQILDNWADLASVFAAYCTGLQIKDCLVRNYARIAIDDRTTIPFFGFAFNCINGTGIMVRHSTGTRIEGCDVVELRLLPTPELKAKYNLGKYVKKNAQKGSQVSQEGWDAEYINGWDQGAAIQVTKGETTDYVQLLGNYIENAAQGIDIHGDHVIMAYNIINNAFIGMKAIHGSRNVIIVGNQFSRNDLWSICLQPGSSSHPAMAASEANQPDPADPEALTWTITRPGANIDGHSIIANNIISDFGHGTSHWMWNAAHTSPIQFKTAPARNLDKTPPETDVIISGNVIYDPGRDGILVGGKPVIEPPHYQYAVFISTGAQAPRGLHFSNNLFNPGTSGVSNVDLNP